MPQKHKTARFPKRFGNELDTPIVESAAEGETSAFIRAEMARKKQLLMKYYGVSPTSSRASTQLLDKVLADYIPGFQVVPSRPKGIGRPDRWLGPDGLKLMHAVEQAIRSHADRQYFDEGLPKTKPPSTRQICRQLVKSKKFKDMKAETLHRAYHRFKKHRTRLATLEDFKDSWSIEKLQEIIRKTTKK